MGKRTEVSLGDIGFHEGVQDALLGGSAYPRAILLEIGEVQSICNLPESPFLGFFFQKRCRTFFTMIAPVRWVYPKTTQVQDWKREKNAGKLVFPGQFTSFPFTLPGGKGASEKDAAGVIPEYLPGNHSKECTVHPTGEGNQERALRCQVLPYMGKLLLQI
jgi:hypothetical protein